MRLKTFFEKLNQFATPWVGDGVVFTVCKSVRLAYVAQRLSPGDLQANEERAIVFLITGGVIPKL